MEKEIWVQKHEDVKYRIRDYDGEEFDNIFSTSADHFNKKTLTEIAERIGSDRFYDEPCLIDDYQCEVDILYKNKIYTFIVAGESDIIWDVDFSEVQDYEGPELE